MDTYNTLVVSTYLNNYDIFVTGIHLNELVIGLTLLCDIILHFSGLFLKHPKGRRRGVLIKQEKKDSTLGCLCELSDLKTGHLLCQDDPPLLMENRRKMTYNDKAIMGPNYRQLLILFTLQ